MILILNGSPNESGYTGKLIKKIVAGIDEQFVILNAYDLKVLPCNDCKYCDDNEGCSQHDDMSRIYDLLESSDKLIVASPLYFASISSKLLDVITRFQTYYTKKFHRKEEVLKIKKSTLICTAGGNWETMFNGPLETMKIINMLFSVKESNSLLVRNTDTIDTLITDVTAHIEFLK